MSDNLLVRLHDRNHGPDVAEAIELLKDARWLLSNVVADHIDPTSQGYNDCDNGRTCEWCVAAKAVIARLR